MILFKYLSDYIMDYIKIAIVLFINILCISCLEPISIIPYPSCDETLSCPTLNLVCVNNTCVPLQSNDLFISSTQNTTNANLDILDSDPSNSFNQNNIQAIDMQRPIGHLDRSYPNMLVDSTIDDPLNMDSFFMTDIHLTDMSLANIELDTGVQCESSLCPGVRCNGEVCAHYDSCLALKVANPALPSGIYEIKPQPNLIPFKVYCEMEIADGGWTLMIKADGHENTFNYNANYWENDVLLNDDSLDMSYTQAKLRGFQSIALNSILLVLVDKNLIPAERKWVSLNVTANSLRDLFSNGTTSIDSPSRIDWLGLDPLFRVQEYCNLGGINIYGESSGSSRVRVGLIANNEANCHSTDSFLGIGGCRAWNHCDSSPNLVSVGNAGEYLTQPPHYISNHRFGYLLIR